VRLLLRTTLAVWCLLLVALGLEPETAGLQVLSEVPLVLPAQVVQLQSPPAQVVAHPARPVQSQFPSLLLHLVTVPQLQLRRDQGQAAQTLVETST